MVESTNATGNALTNAMGTIVDDELVVVAVVTLRNVRNFVEDEGDVIDMLQFFNEYQMIIRKNEVLAY